MMLMAGKTPAFGATPLGPSAAASFPQGQTAQPLVTANLDLSPPTKQATCHRCSWSSVFDVGSVAAGVGQAVEVWCRPKVYALARP
jgi:hypothetical protein